jgi:hypothetical protein
MGVARANSRGVNTNVVDASDTAKAKKNVRTIIRRNLLFRMSPTRHKGIVQAARRRIAPAVLVSVNFTAFVERSRIGNQA